MRTVRGNGRLLARVARSHAASAAVAEDSGSWAVSYGDMVTLLLCFFIMFFNLSPAKKQLNHFKVIQNTLQETLKGSPVAAKGFQTQIAMGEKARAHEIDKTILAKLGGVMTKVGDQIFIEFPDVSFFNLGQTKLRPEAVAILGKFASIYAPFSAEFRLAVLAYTDDVPVRRGHHLYSDNLELSSLRSVAAMRSLQGQGIPVSAMRIAGHGELKEAKVQTEAKPLQERGDPLARRVSLIIEPQKWSMQ